jgi:AcrR family transcriptional regulator
LASESAAAEDGNGKPLPKQARAVKTRDMLLDVAGALLEEVGIERISTNLICQRAGMTPPALYRYFADKYAVLEALGIRLMERQQAAIGAWVDRQLTIPEFSELAAHLEELLRATVAVTEAEPGGLWIERAISATPSLEHVRNEARRRATDALTDGAAAFLPGVPREAIWMRMRVAAEFGYVVGELLREQSGVSRDAIFSECTKMLSFAVTGWAAEFPLLIEGRPVSEP